VEQINENYSRGGVGGGGVRVQSQSGQEILNSGKIWEEQREYGKAID